MEIPAQQCSRIARLACPVTWAFDSEKGIVRLLTAIWLLEMARFQVRGRMRKLMIDWDIESKAVVGGKIGALL